MRRRGRARCAAVLVSAVWIAWFSSPASARERRPALQFHAGVFNVNKGEKDLDLGAELRLPTPFWKLYGKGGLGVSGKGAVWLYFGMRRDFRLSEKWVLAPGFGFAHYAARSGKDLGGPLEFRSAIDLGYRIGPGKRLGLTLFHLSNAGHYARNPGSNSLVVTYSFDFK